MGIWEWINSTTETVKRNAPYPTAVKDACKTSYGYCSAAAGKVDNAVRVNGIQRVNGYLSDEETRSQISLFASKFVKNAALILIPGAKTVAEIFSETMDDVKSENLRKQEMKARKEVSSVEMKWWDL